MAYYVFSSFDANVVEGPLFVRAGVNPANVERAVSSIDTELKRMATDGLSAQELADCQQYLIGSIPRLLETNSAIATFLQTAEFFGLGLDHDLQLPDFAWERDAGRCECGREGSARRRSSDGRRGRAVPAMTEHGRFSTSISPSFTPVRRFRAKAIGRSARATEWRWTHRDSRLLSPARLTSSIGSRKRSTTRRSSSTTRRTSSDRWVGEALRSRPAPPRSTTSGRRAITSCSTTRCRRLWGRWRGRGCNSASSQTRTEASTRFRSTSSWKG